MVESLNTSNLLVHVALNELIPNIQPLYTLHHVLTCDAIITRHDNVVLYKLQKQSQSHPTS